MTDIFAHQMRSPGDPATSVFAITPDDATDLPQVTVAVGVTTPGTVRVTMRDGSIGDLSLVPGTSFPVRVSRVWQTGTTATGITGLG